MKVVIQVENENMLAAGWACCHLGLKPDCLGIGVGLLSPLQQEGFALGFKMRNECGDMDNPRDSGHGTCHVCWLMQVSNQNIVPFIRDRVTATLIQ